MFVVFFHSVLNTKVYHNALKHVFSINRKERNTKNIFQKNVIFIFSFDLYTYFILKQVKKFKKYKRDISHFPVVSLPLGLPMLLFLTGAPRCGHVETGEGKLRRSTSPGLGRSPRALYHFFFRNTPVKKKF